MFDKRSQFARADREVSELKTRIARQRAAVERAKHKGHPSAAALSILRSLEDSLRVFERHRQAIFDRLEANQRIELP
jgi:hypothetical protein